jgi:hypothetical protein
MKYLNPDPPLNEPTDEIMGLEITSYDAVNTVSVAIPV